MQVKRNQRFAVIVGDRLIAKPLVYLTIGIDIAIMNQGNALIPNGLAIA